MNLSTKYWNLGLTKMTTLLHYRHLEQYLKEKGSNKQQVKISIIFFKNKLNYYLLISDIFDSVPNYFIGKLRTLKFVSCLGKGSFGLVLKKDNNDGSYSALKIIYKDGIENENSLKRECTLVKDRVNKNIVQIQDVFEHCFFLEDIDEIINAIENDEAQDELELRKSRIRRYLIKCRNFKRLLILIFN